MNIEVVSPFPIESLPRVWGWIETFRAQVSDDFGPQTLDAFVANFIANASAQQSWAVYRDGEMGGMINFQPISSWYGVGHFLFKKELWGFETTIPALRLAFAEVFAQGYGKIGGFPYKSNWQIRGVLNRLGAVKEGILRSHTISNGRPAHICAYALFKEEFENGTVSSRNRRRASPVGRRGNRGAAQNADLDHHNHAPVVAGDVGPERPTLGV